MALQKVDLNKAYLLINHSPTVIILASHGDIVDAMSASWVCPLDYDKVTAVIDSGSFTRSLFEKSGKFGLLCHFLKIHHLLQGLELPACIATKTSLLG